MIRKRVSLLLKRKRWKLLLLYEALNPGHMEFLDAIKSSNFSKIRLELVHLNIKQTGIDLFRVTSEATRFFDAFYKLIHI